MKYKWGYGVQFNGAQVTEEDVLDIFGKVVDRPEKVEAEEYKSNGYKEGVRGFVYVIYSQGLCKIGSTSKLKNRISHFRSANPYIEIRRVFKSKDMYKFESLLHEAFRSKRVRGEWFKLSAKDFKKLDKIVGKNDEEAY